MESISQTVEFSLNFTEVHTRLLKRADGCLSVHGISYSEFMVLYHLGGAPSRMMKRVELAERVGLTASGVTRMLGPMEKIGLVVKKATLRDARVSLVELTPSGLDILENAKGSVDQAVQGFLGALTPGGFNSLNKTLKQLGASL